MTELKFYTDGDKVYLNNDKGVTKEVDLSALFGEGGGSELPEYSGSDVGKYVTPDAQGVLGWQSLPAEVFPVVESAQGTLDKTFAELMSAYQSRKMIVLFWEHNQGYTGAKYIYMLSYIFHDDEYPEDDMCVFSSYGGGSEIKYFHPVDGVMTEYYPD